MLTMQRHMEFDRCLIVQTGSGDGSGDDDGYDDGMHDMIVMIQNLSSDCILQMMIDHATMKMYNCFVASTALLVRVWTDLRVWPLSTMSLSKSSCQLAGRNSALPL